MLGNVRTTSRTNGYFATLVNYTFDAPDESMSHQSARIIRAMYIAIEKKSEESGKR